ncbi:MAG: alpha/beta hydrolase [Alphaproteobacteria bacterium]|jgi:hypothetical protein|nr:alpha/beta hydrolase [Candidatus Fonsibacter sp. PEL55]
MLPYKLNLILYFKKAIDMKFLLSIFFLLTLTINAKASQNCAVILMHGKWGLPYSTYLKILSEKIEKLCLIERPEMPWSRNRNYDQTYESLLNELQKKSENYRKKGIKKIIFAGHSFGANASMAYQAYIGDADALIAIAPGHNPYGMYHIFGLVPGHALKVDNAKKNIDEGKPEILIKFIDLNYGVSIGMKKEFEIRSDIFFSYYNPEGLAHMVRTAKEFKKATPFLYIEGDHDNIKVGSKYSFEKTPFHPMSKYQTVVADHAMAPEVASDLVIEWLKEIVK